MKLLTTLGILASLAAPFAFGEEANPTPVTRVQLSEKVILGDRDQFTAYTFDVDAPNESKCYNACATNWPPMLLKEGETTDAPYGETIRKDGSRQITLDGRPLYLFAGDEQVGDIKGDGLNGTWHIIVL